MSSLRAFAVVVLVLFLVPASGFICHRGGTILATRALGLKTSKVGAVVATGACIGNIGKPSHVQDRLQPQAHTSWGQQLMRRQAFLSPATVKARPSGRKAVNWAGLVLGTVVSSSVLLCGGVPEALAGTYASSDTSGITFQYPDDQGLVLSPKLVKTHGTEVFLKSATVKGLSVGVTVDPVRIGNIRDFATPEGLAERVVQVEKSKEGVFEANVLSARESARPVSLADPSIPAYEIEYMVDSSRGQNHYVVKTTVIDSKLYVFTVQSKEATFPAISNSAFDIIATFHVGS